MGVPKTKKLDEADSQLQSNPSVNDGIDGTRKVCGEPQNRATLTSDESAKLKEIYVFIGLRLVVKQFNIEGRGLQVLLPIVTNEKVDNAEVLHQLSGSAWTVAGSFDDKPSPKLMYGIGGGIRSPGFYQADLTSNSQLIIKENQPGYWSGEGGDGAFNDFLGKAVALHIARDHTYTNTETGDFYCKDVKRGTAEFRATEKMGIKVFAYVSLKLNGTDGIYEVKNGKIASSAISPTEYLNRKRIRDNQYSDGECGSMPLIPGVQQFHVFIKESGGSFSLEEVYCDGDCIYPN